MITFILMDIEGTTTAISFVHEVLFPYASANMASFIRKNHATPTIGAELEAVKQTVREEESRVLTEEETIQQLLSWIQEDRKHTALKTLQGHLWKNGYEAGDYQGHIYEDVVPALQRWQQAGIQLGIYSSGSVAAQKLLFGYSNYGDLTPYLSAYFDTKIGHKREVVSYQNIQAQIGVPAAQILFLSDVEAELNAAKVAGFKTIQLVRPGTTASKKHITVENFSQIKMDA